MKTRHSLLLRIIACLLLAGLAGGLGVTHYLSLTTYRSPLNENPPQPGSAIGQPATRRVIFVLVDALRLNTSLKEEVMPNLAHLRFVGASASMHSRAPSYSEPGWGTLFTGAWPDLNDSPPLNMDYDSTWAWTQDNLFSAASRAGLKTAAAGYDWFEKLIPADALTYGAFTAGEDHLADVGVMEGALPWLQDESIQFVMIHLDQVDYAGHHEGGPQNPDWNAAAARVDVMIGQVLENIDLSQDTLLVCSDHGQIDAGGHGGADPETLIEPFMLAGAGVRPGSYEDIQMVDVAPTLATLLGVNIPASAQGRVLTEMLALPGETLQQLPHLTQAQQQSLLQSYAAATGHNPPQLASANLADFQVAIESLRSTHLYRQQFLRGAFAALLLGLILWLFIRRWKRENLWLLAGALLYLVVFHLRYAVIDRRAYSYSAINSPLDLVLYLLVTGAIALGIGWLAAAAGLHLFSQGRRNAAQITLNLALTSAFIVSLPFLWGWVSNGIIPWWTLPNMTDSFWMLVSLAQVLLICLLGLLFAGIAAVIADSRRSR